MVRNIQTSVRNGMCFVYYSIGHTEHVALQNIYHHLDKDETSWKKYLINLNKMEYFVSKQRIALSIYYLKIILRSI